MKLQPDANGVVSPSSGWLVTGAAAVAASLGAAAILEGYGVAGTSLLTGAAGVVTGGAFPSVALLVGSSLFAAAAVSSAAAAALGKFGRAKRATKHGREDTWEPEPQPQSSTAMEPLLATKDSGQVVELDAAQSAAGVVEDIELTTSFKPKLLPRHAACKQRKLLDEAKREAEAWIAALMLYGVSVRLAGKSQKVRLENQPLWDTLVLGEEQLPLMGVAFRLDGRILTLACEDSAAEQCERTFQLHMASDDDALGLTLALKLLRGKADTGAGVAAWGSRPLDRLERPPPAE